MIERKAKLKILSFLRNYPVVAIIGPRQVGKTTLAKQIFKEWNSSGRKGFYFDLENPEDEAYLSDPMLALKPLSGLIVMDEVQRRPDLFSIIRVLVDESPRKRKFLLLGSASPSLIKGSAQSLAGRIAYYRLFPFSVEEVGQKNLERLWLRGGFPRSFLARSEEDSLFWRRNFISTFLERDIPALGISIGAYTIHRFWLMLAHFHAQILNFSELARSFGVSDATVRRYIELLSGTFMVYLLKPWFANISKRQVKSPKIYISDSGILHALLGLESRKDLLSHPKSGGSWEGFIINQVMDVLEVGPDDCYFWRTHSGAELDLLVERKGQRFGFEIKLTSSPKVLPSMKIALEDLRLSHLFVIHAGDRSFPLDKKITALSCRDLSLNAILKRKAH